MSKIFILILLLLFQMDAKETVALNMIVKNEKDIIKRCLDSAKPLIDYWVIVDTGSTDGTQDIIREVLKDIPGELHERPWINFEHNRNEALTLALGKSDYILFIDADEVFQYGEGFKWPSLKDDFYYIMTEYGGTRYYRTQLIKSNLDWKWVGVLHEVLISPKAKKYSAISGIVDYVRTDGARSKDPLKFQKDAALLESAHQKDPSDTRTLFYLAQSYKDGENYVKAYEAYTKRVALKGWDEEVFWSLYQLAHLEKFIDPSKVNERFLEAWKFRETRVEPLYYLANRLRLDNNFEEAYRVSKWGAFSEVPNDVLFVERWIYDWGLLFEFSIASYYVQKYEESFLSSRYLLTKELPENVREAVKNNLIWIEAKIKENNKASMNDLIKLKIPE